MQTYRQKIDLFVWFEEFGRVELEGWRCSLRTRFEQGVSARALGIDLMPF